MRIFMGRDFEPLARLLGETWHSHRAGAQAYWHGADELCEHLMHTDQGFVAEDDEGGLAGAILLESPRATDHNAQLRGHWASRRTLFSTMARAIGVPPAPQSFLADEVALIKQAAQQFGAKDVGEVVLLILREDMRGQGLGRALLAKGTSWLAEHGATAYRLVTDDDCDWQFYEYLGLRRILTSTYSDDPDCHLYIYEGSI